MTTSSICSPLMRDVSPSTISSKCWDYTSEEVVRQRLAHMALVSMEVSKDLSHFSSVLKSSKQAKNRAHAIRWIKEVGTLSDMSPDARDTSVQIFDRYFSISSREDPSALNNSHLFSTVAAVSILLSSKFHESRPLSMSSFSNFTPEILSKVENDVLITLDYNLFPMSTPAGFIHHVLLLRPRTDKDNDLTDLVETKACHLIGEFWESPSSCRFLPSVIALAALVIVFSSLRVEYSSWFLSCFPGCCRLAINECVMELQKIFAGEPASRLDSVSPVSIIDGCRANTPLAETAALSLSDSAPPVPSSAICSVDAQVSSYCKTGSVKRIKLF